MGLESLMPVPPPPSEERISVERVAVEATCPRCGSTDVARYPIANYIGPRMATKCQDCFYSLSVDVPEESDHWPPWRSPTLDWESTRAG